MSAKRRRNEDSESSCTGSRLCFPNATVFLKENLLFSEEFQDPPGSPQALPAEISPNRVTLSPNRVILQPVTPQPVSPDRSSLNSEQSLSSQSDQEHIINQENDGNQRHSPLDEDILRDDHEPVRPLIGDMFPEFEEFNHPELEIPLQEENGYASSDSGDSDEEFVLEPVQLEDEELLRQENNDPPLYYGAPITLLQSVLAIWTFATVHNLTGVALSDLLAMISMHCIARNRVCLQTLYKFKKFFENIPSPDKTHYFCSNCFSPLASKNDQCDDCGEDFRGVSYFLEVSIISQLQTMFKRPGFFHCLSFPVHRVRKYPHNYEDIYDGRIYKNKVRDGFHDTPAISFLWNSDGLKIFKSSKFSSWPFYLSITQLPFSKRFKKENVVLAGLWFGEDKPKLPLYLNAFHNDLARLHQGVSFEVPGFENEVMVKGAVLCGTCDLPAKCHFLNIKQYNGYYGCPNCKARGERSERTQNGHAYPPDDHAPLRTEEETERFARLAEEYNTPIFGIKGISSLAMFVRNYITTTAIDVMHCVFEGVAKKLMELWFHPNFRNENFSLEAASAAINQMLSLITPPSYIKRMPRSVTDHLCYWKASEFKSWLLYYSVPILSTVMSREYLNHHMALVHAIFLLCQDSISENMVIEAERCLEFYIINFPRLYGYKYLTINFHLLSHLPENVRNFGPLFTTSCFMFEDLIGKFKKFVHGTTHAALQMASGLSQYINLPILFLKLNEADQVRQWCDKLVSKERLMIIENIGGPFYSVGNYVKPVNLPLVLENALIEAGLNGNVTVFYRLKKGKFLISSLGYTRSTKTNSTAVKFKRNNALHYGLNELFVKLTNCECEHICNCEGEFYSLVNVLHTITPFRVEPLELSLFHVMQCERREFCLIPVQSIETLCFFFTVDNSSFVVHPVNPLENE